MRLRYWMCEGIGFNIDDLMLLLDPEKIRLVMCETDSTYTEEENPEWYESFLKMLPEEKIDEIIARYEEEETFNNIFFSRDTRNVLSSPENGGGTQYILFPPGYPWYEGRDYFTSMDIVKEYLCDVVMNFTFDTITKAELMGLINTDIYEIGCG